MPDLKPDFLLDPNVIFLNHGSFGATPKPVFESYQRWQRELEAQPVEFLARRMADMLHRSREVLADYLGTDTDNIVYVSNATTGINIVARSLDLKEGDEVLATDHEYGAMDRTWRFLAQKQGFAYRIQKLPIPFISKSAIIDLMFSAVTTNIRIIFISHITSPTAAIFPIKEICNLAREKGILTVIDGAHAPGQIALNLEGLGADFYSGNLHKWLCAPKGSAFLFARPQVQNLLEPLVVSWGWESDQPGPSKFIDILEWQGTRDISSFLAVPDAIQYQKSHDWDSIRQECHQLARQTIHEISARFGFPPLYPNSAEWFAQMAAARLPDTVDIDILKTRLYDDFRIEVPLIDFHGEKLIRVSFQAYNTSSDSQSLLYALSKLL